MSRAMVQVKLSAFKCKICIFGLPQQGQVANNRMQEIGRWDTIPQTWFKTGSTIAWFLSIGSPAHFRLDHAIVTDYRHWSMRRKSGGNSGGAEADAEGLVGGE